MTVANIEIILAIALETRGTPFLVCRGSWLWLSMEDPTPPVDTPVVVGGLKTRLLEGPKSIELEFLGGEVCHETQPKVLETRCTSGAEMSPMFHFDPGSVAFCRLSASKVCTRRRKWMDSLHAAQAGAKPSETGETTRRRYAQAQVQNRSGAEYRRIPDAYAQKPGICGDLRVCT